MESGDLHDLCGNDMTDIDCDNSQNDSTVENLADCDNSQDNASEIDANIDVNDQFDDTELPSLQLWVQHHCSVMPILAVN